MDELYVELAGAGIGKIVIDYSGSNDEGWIGDQTATAIQGSAQVVIPEHLERHLEQWAYDVLENHHPGWEINEGSDGNITIDVVARTAVLNHNENVVTQKLETTSL